MVSGCIVYRSFANGASQELRFRVYRVVVSNSTGKLVAGLQSSRLVYKYKFLNMLPSRQGLRSHVKKRVDELRVCETFRTPKVHFQRCCRGVHPEGVRTFRNRKVQASIDSQIVAE